MSEAAAAAAANMAANYKKLKEDFVSGHSGGDVSEILYVTAVAPVAVMLWSALQTRQSMFTPLTEMGFITDFLLNVGGILLAITAYSSSPILLNILLAAPAILLLGLPVDPDARPKKPKLPPNAKSSALPVLPLKPFLTTYRGTMMVVTCLAILAVDFRVFPRRFAKVETWGTSLMDIGVGSFVFSGGVVAARPLLKERAAGKSTPLLRRLGASFRHSVPLIVLGVIRLLSVKGLDYAEHVTEYGVHWNFFFTLALLPPFVAASQSALRAIPSYAVLALLIAGLYQVTLENTRLKAYILTAPRADLISMNREGIFSFAGYLAIFLAGQDVGMYVLPRSVNPRSGSSASSQRQTLLMTMAVWAAVWWGLYFLATDFRFGAGLAVSRRLANLPYVLWVVAFNVAQMFCFCLVDTLFFPAAHTATDAKGEREAYGFATSAVLRAFNRNGLALFLLANLGTGLVNLTVPTLEVDPRFAMLILMVYGLALTGVAVALDQYDISIKL